MAGGIAATLTQPVALAEASLTCHVSIGVGLSDRGLPAADLLRHADTAMYAAKATAAGAVVYTSELDQGRAERLALLADLHLALERHELTLRYQPKLDLATGQISGAEALVRWQHPQLGTLGPDTFIPLAESTGLIDALTDQVLRQALTDCRTWQQLGLDLSVAINISGRSISDPTLPRTHRSRTDRSRCLRRPRHPGNHRRQRPRRSLRHHPHPYATCRPRRCALPR